MTLEEITTAIRQLDDQDFNALSDQMFIMREERRARPAVEQAKREAEAETVTKIAQQLAEEHPELVEKPVVQTGGEVREWEPWHPLKESTHYRYGDKTSHNGKTWRDELDPTRTALNVWEPGAPGTDERYWVEETEPETTEAEDAPETTETGTAPETPTTTEWAPGINVKPGERYRFQGDTYEVVQAHQTASHWPPDAVPALYKKL